MNKKDIQRLQATERAAAENPSVTSPSPADFAKAVADAVRSALAEIVKQPAEPPRKILDEPWFRLYCAAVGGQMGWLCSSSDAKKLQQRLGILADIAQSAANFAVNRGKVARK